MVSLSQHSMSAGVPPHEMASQDVPVVASPTMVSEVMAMEEINPWSDAKQVEVLMSSPLTRVKEPMYLTASQDLSRDREARKMEKVERLRIQSVKDAEKKNVAGRLPSKTWIAWKLRVRVVLRLTKPERLGEDTRAHSRAEGLTKHVPRSRRALSPILHKDKVLNCYWEVGSSWYSSTIFPPKGRPGASIDLWIWI